MQPRACEVPSGSNPPILKEVIRFDCDIEAASSMSHRNVAPSLGRRSQFESALENREQTQGLRLGILKIRCGNRRARGRLVGWAICQPDDVDVCGLRVDLSDKQVNLRVLRRRLAR